jgi:peptidoglycan/xylan/chitin deacetylase (PgdA/CDA1 family)
MSMAGLFRHLGSSGLAVVTYHGVLPPGYEPVDAAFDGNLITADTLRLQIRLLKSQYKIVSPEDVLAWREGTLEGAGELPPRAVLLTCDDGLLNCLTDMLPVLQQEEVTCLFFVTGASTARSRAMLWYEDLFLLFLGGTAGHLEIPAEGGAIQGVLGTLAQRRAAWWDAVKRLSQMNSQTRISVLWAARSQLGAEAKPGFDPDDPPSCRRFGLMTVDELRQLASAGMSIGAHTLSHPLLSQTPPEIAREEIFGSKTVLESALQQRVWALAYPFGDPQSVTPQVLSMAREAGFAAAFLNYGGGLGTALPQDSLPRIHVTAGMSLSEFEAHVSGFYARLHRVGRGLTHSDVIQDHAANG